jgi:3-oxoacyl-[acyl-carrier protein] reductase
LVDVSDPASVQRAATDLDRRGLGLDVLVVNAGIGLWAPFGDVSPENWRTTLGTNLDGAFYTLQSTLPLLLKRRGSTVLVIGSDSAEYGFEGRAPYCASKWGLRGLVESFREEYRPSGLRVTMIFVSRVKTHFGGKTPEQRTNALDAEELGELAAWLVNRPQSVEYREVKVSAIAAAYGE